MFLENPRVLGFRRRLFLAPVAYRQTPSYVYVGNFNPVAPEPVGQVDKLRYGLGKGGKIKYLGTYMGINSLYLNSPIREAFLYTSTAFSIPIPNLLFSKPVDMYGWVSGSTSGLTLIATGAPLSERDGHIVYLLKLRFGFHVEKKVSASELRPLSPLRSSRLPRTPLSKCLPRR